jgi:Xaa-Pro aminopeptidase
MEGITFVPGEQVFRKIRVVKTEPEIALMRLAGAANGAAAMATIRQMQKGMTFDEVERIWKVECAKRGNDDIQFIAGMVTGLFPHGEIVEGRSFVIDAVSHHRQYHGDFGRTVIVGEPSKALLAREKAHKAGHDAVYAIVKPGVKFSELRKVAIDAEVKAGLPREILSCTPHGVGLEHGDNPARLDVPFTMAEDMTLEENMVITIDLPYIEIGADIGHHEDLIRITKTGFEPLNPLGDPLVIV